MTNRLQQIDNFLGACGWADAKRGPLAGDASNRRYERLVAADGTPAVLMDAPKEKGEDVRPFVDVTEFLRAQGLSAPEILHADTGNGFLLLEDLGDDLFARVMAKDPSQELPLYQAATDVLVALHDVPAPADLAPYDPAYMSEMAALAYRWYLRGTDAPFEDKAQQFQAAFQNILSQYTPDCDVLIQRDYHAENLLWLPDRDDVARVGLLDYQDAMTGHRAYDLVSLLQDARREVSPKIETEMIRYYLSKSNQDPEAFDAAYHVLGAQRNLRILGVFGRLCMSAGKPHYIDLIPRVWTYLLRDLAHPTLAPVRDMILNELPTPSETVLAKLKNKCATLPTP